jgi:hypothetical protein
MKYIIIEIPIGNSGLLRDLPIIFPDELVHAEVFACVSRHDGVARARPIAAGFLSSMSVGETGACYGESESLGKLKSRGKIDDQLISMIDYTHGVKDTKA